MISVEAKLMSLKDAYMSTAFPLSGIDERAKRNNRQIIACIKSQGKFLQPQENEVFGIFLAGSRVKGYHTDSSDVDLIVIASSDSPNLEFFIDILNREFTARGITNSIDYRMNRLANPDLGTADQLWSMVDKEEYKIASLYGYPLYENNNLYIARLAVLELLSVLDINGYKWRIVQGAYAHRQLGIKYHFWEKVGEKLGISPDQVGNIFTDEVFQKHNDRFRLPTVESQLRKLRRIYERSAASNNHYVMDEIYREVCNRIYNNLCI